MQKILRAALIGRANVGKSSLFNRLLLAGGSPRQGGRRAIVANFEGVTRDLIHGEIVLPQGKIIINDSPGQMLDNDPLHQLMAAKAEQGHSEAELLLFVCDGQAGLTALDQELIARLRARQSREQECLLLVNKMDAKDAALSEFYRAGFTVLGVSAKTGAGLKELLGLLREKLAAQPSGGDAEDNSAAVEAAPPKALALLGCPNAGKSTLANLLLGRERQLVHHLPGSTRDSVYLPLGLAGEQWTLIDTAGIRRKAKVDRGLEQESVRAAIQAINASDLVAYIIDAEQGVRKQDLTLLQLTAKSGKGVVIAVNKSDLLTAQQQKDLKGILAWELAFIGHAPLHFISAKQGRGLRVMFKSIKQVCAAMAAMPGSRQLNHYLQEFTRQHPPPLRQGRRSNLRYVVQTAQNPPRLTIHGKRTEQLPDSYKKYLQNSFTQKLKLVGAPLGIAYKNDANPYAKPKARTKAS